jgi:hypothetical protein
MREFRVPLSRQGPDRRLRLVVWQMIGMLVGLCLAGYAALTPDLEFRKPLFYFSAVIMITDLVIFPYFLLRAGFRRVNYDLTYVLTDADLTRKRVGWPDIRIGRSDIKALREGQEWLVVASNDPQSKDSHSTKGRWVRCTSSRTRKARAVRETGAGEGVARFPYSSGLLRVLVAGDFIAEDCGGFSGGNAGLTTSDVVIVPSLPNVSSQPEAFPLVDFSWARLDYRADFHRNPNPAWIPKLVLGKRVPSALASAP